MSAPRGAPIATIGTAASQYPMTAGEKSFSQKTWTRNPGIVAIVIRITVVGVTIFSLIRKSSTMTMKATEFSPVPTSALTIPPRKPAAIRMMRS